MAGHTHIGSHGRRRLREGGQQFLDSVRHRRHRSVGIQPRTQPAAGRSQLRLVHPRWPGDSRRRLAAAVEKYLYSRASGRSRCAKRPRFSAPERCQNPFDMLACSERVDSVVDAAAGICGPFEASYFHVIAGLAGRADAKFAEKPAIRIECDDVLNFSASPPAPQADLVLVAGPPTQNGRAFEHGGGLALAGASAGLFAGGSADDARVSRHLLLDVLTITGRRRQPNEYESEPAELAFFTCAYLWPWLDSVRNLFYSRMHRFYRAPNT